MVVFDAHFLMLALKPEIPCSVDNSKERVLKLLADLQEAGEKIIIPTPALTEFLVHAENAASSYLEQIQKSSRFKIASFATRAAVEVAAVIAEAVTKRHKKDGSRDTWAKVNFDRQIAAIGKVEGAHTIYTDDGGLANFSRKLNLKPVGLAELSFPPPPPQRSLDFDKPPTNKEQKTNGQASQESDSPPASIPRGGSSPAEDQARTKIEKEDS